MKNFNNAKRNIHKLTNQQGKDVSNKDSIMKIIAFFYKTLNNQKRYLLKIYTVDCGSSERKIVVGNPRKAVGPLYCITPTYE